MAKNLCLSAAIACLAVLPGAALAGNFVTGSSSAGNISVSDNANWTTLRTLPIPISSSDAAVHGCVASASADVRFEEGARDALHRFIFTVTRDDINPLTDGTFERTLDFIDNTSVLDPGVKSVATARQFTGLTRTNGLNGSRIHTFRLLGRRLTADSSVVTVTDSSLTVMCVHTP